MRRRLWILAIVTAFLLLAGCSKESGPSESQPDYFPLQLGNQWTFTVTKPDSAGTDSTYTEIQTVDHTTQYDSLEWFVVVKTTETDTDSTYYRRGDYFLEAIFFYQGRILEDIIAVSPLEPSVGFVWSDTVNIEVEGEVVAETTITVPAGTFDCFEEHLLVSALGGLVRLEITNYLADGVGPVKIVYVSSGDTTDMELTEYSLQ